VQDAETGSSGPQWIGERLHAGDPLWEEKAPSPHRRPRVRGARLMPALEAVGPRFESGQETAAPAVVPAPAGITDAPDELPVSISDAIAAASREPSLDAAGLALVGGIANALDIESAYLYVLEDAEGAPCLRLFLRSRQL